jgi:catechol 1,2-dioxygenase
VLQLHADKLANPKRNMASNGTAANGSKAHKFNPDFTQAVINATGPKATPRVRQLTAGLIQHLHDFARENELTVDEWMAGVELVRSHSVSCCTRN